MKTLLKVLLPAMFLIGALAYTIPSEFHANQFEKGEHLSYKVKYDLYINIPVAQMDFIIEDELKEFAGQDCLHLKAVGKTYRFYYNFFKVRDYFDAYVDPGTLEPKLFTRNISEGNYSKDDYTIFYPSENYVKTKKGKKIEVPENTWDILSVWYLARTFDFEDMEVGDSVKMHTFIDDETYPIGLQYAGKETVKTDAGKIECYVIKPMLVVGELFKSESEMTLWVSADENKIPVIIESGISVGKVRAELNSYKNLKHDFDALKD